MSDLRSFILIFEFYIFVLSHYLSLFPSSSHCFQTAQFIDCESEHQPFMNPIVQRMQSSYRHKKATSTLHHINNHYPHDFQKHKSKSRQDNPLSNLHKRAKSFSKDSRKFQPNHDYCHERIPAKYSQQIKSQIAKPQKKPRYEKSLKQKKQDFLRDYIKSESQSRKYKKKDKTKIELKPAKSSPQNRSNSKSAQKYKTIKELKTLKLKPQSKQKKPHSKQMSRQKNSKDSKTSKASKHRKSDQLNSMNKISHKRDLENKLGRQKKGIQINFKNISLRDNDLNSENFPMSPEQATQNFKEHLNQSEIDEMKEYKSIYFMGRDFEHRQKNAICSARENRRERIQNQEDYTLNQSKKYHYFQTQNVPIEKKSLEDSEYTSQFYQYTIGSHIAYRYEIISSINRGSFGEVLKVFDHKTKEFLAIKVVKKSKDLVQQTFVQISILTNIKENDKGNTSGIVRIKDFLLFRNHICIIFELLDGNLYELLTANGFKGFSQDVIRLFAVQILNSLNFLRKQKIIHCDLKPENLVMKNWGKSGIKLIDFGTSCFEGKQMYSYLQSRYYRAPEVFMQMPYSYPIDMWSFGCMIAQFKIGQPLFSGRSTIEQLIYISSCLGLPNKNDGLFSLAYLENETLKQVISNNYSDKNKQNGFNLGENLFQEKYKEKLKKQCMFKLEERFSKKGGLDPSFYDFVEKILKWEPDKRLTPEEALRHPWITKGMSSQIYSLYSSFNTAESCSKSKKNSKESKKSNESREKSRKKRKLRQVLKGANQEQRGGEQNKINYCQKMGTHEERLMNVREELERISDQKRKKLNAFFGRNDGQSTGRMR